MSKPMLGQYIETEEATGVLYSAYFMSLPPNGKIRSKCKTQQVRLVPIHKLRVCVV